MVKIVSMTGSARPGATAAAAATSTATNEKRESEEETFCFMKL